MLPIICKTYYEDPDFQSQPRPYNMEDDNAGLLLYDGGKRCSIFVVDYGEHMFLKGGQNFQMALKV